MCSIHAVFISWNIFRSRIKYSHLRLDAQKHYLNDRGPIFVTGRQKGSELVLRFGSSLGSEGNNLQDGEDPALFLTGGEVQIYLPLHASNSKLLIGEGKQELPHLFVVQDA